MNTVSASRSSLIRRSFVVLATALLLAGCATRPGPGSLKISQEAEGSARDHKIIIATTRQRATVSGTYFTNERADELDFATATVSVPPAHKPGQIEWPSVPPGDPATDFTLRSAGYLKDRTAFRAEMRKELAKRKPGNRRAFLFVHGYNTRFPEALYRFTQVVDDAQVPSVPVLFTWASGGAVTDYVYDINSAQIARDALEQTLRDLAASGAERIDILAHSMGTYLLLETLRQISISPHGFSRDRFGTIALAAPDIDIDLFKQQLQRTGRPEKPFLILVSRDDRALRASSLISGGKQRVGRYENPEELAELGAIVIDLTDLEGDSANHSKFAEIALIAPNLSAALVHSRLGDNVEQPSPTGGKVGDLIGRGANVVLTVPKAILSAPIQIFGAR
ncbi:alpha/beta hydrolase [Breoghania sp.]|uniref:alpha/beta hydrolase n=1 Tax=Breoghania sp. TaxID=2065378 RepID=UPI002AAB3218|nr:alpha/beta hydrolase [Breoghania sp.]